MDLDPLYAMISAATGTDNWEVVSTVPGSLLSIGPFAKSDQLRALRGGELRITGLMRHEGESWSWAARVLLSPIVFCGDDSPKHVREIYRLTSEVEPAKRLRISKRGAITCARKPLHGNRRFNHGIEQRQCRIRHLLVLPDGG